eukprot:2652310-Rhodomonas_salina.2
MCALRSALCAHACAMRCVTLTWRGVGSQRKLRAGEHQQCCEIHAEHEHAPRVHLAASGDGLWAAKSNTTTNVYFVPETA